MQMYIVHNHVCNFALSFPTKLSFSIHLFVSIAILYKKLQTWDLWRDHGDHVHIHFTTAEMKAFSAEWIAWSWWHPRRRRLAPTFRPQELGTGYIHTVRQRLFSFSLQLYCIKGKGSLSDLCVKNRPNMQGHGNCCKLVHCLYLFLSSQTTRAWTASHRKVKIGYATGVLDGLPCIDYIP